jgi:hypothetical protein
MAAADDYHIIPIVHPKPHATEPARIAMHLLRVHFVPYATGP